MLRESPEFTGKERVEKALKAHADYVESYPHDSNPTKELLGLFAWFDRKQEWRELAHKALDRLADPNHAADARAHMRIARGCLSIPTDVEELVAKAIAAAERPLALADENIGQRTLELNTLSIAEFRRGNYPRSEELNQSSQLGA